MFVMGQNKRSFFLLLVADFSRVSQYAYKSRRGLPMGSGLLRQMTAEESMYGMLQQGERHFFSILDILNRSLVTIVIITLKIYVPSHGPATVSSSPQQTKREAYRYGRHRQGE